MSTTITGRLNKPASQFQAGDYQGFGVRLGVKYYDRETKQEEWTNYQAVLFTKSPTQTNFYQQYLIEGAIIELTAEKQQIKSYDGQNGLMLSIDLLDAKLGFLGMSAPKQQQSNQQAQPQNNQQQQNRPAQQQNNQQFSDNFDNSDMPF